MKESLKNKYFWYCMIFMLATAVIGGLMTR